MFVLLNPTLTVNINSIVRITWQDESQGDRTTVTLNEPGAMRPIAIEQEYAEKLWEALYPFEPCPFKAIELPEPMRDVVRELERAFEL